MRPPKHAQHLPWPEQLFQPLNLLNHHLPSIKVQVTPLIIFTVNLPQALRQQLHLARLFIMQLIAQLFKQLIKQPFIEPMRLLILLVVYLVCIAHIEI